MANISTSTPTQFKMMYPKGVYGYTLQWDPDKIKPSYLTYPSKIVVDTKLDRYYYEDKKGNLTSIGYYPHRVSFVDKDFQKVKDSFVAAVKRCAEGRVKWLEQQRLKVDETADGMIKKSLKL